MPWHDSVWEWSKNKILNREILPSLCDLLSVMWILRCFRIQFRILCESILTAETRAPYCTNWVEILIYVLQLLKEQRQILFLFSLNVI